MSNQKSEQNEALGRGRSEDASGDMSWSDARQLKNDVRLDPGGEPAEGGRNGSGSSAETRRAEEI